MLDLPRQQRVERNNDTLRRHTLTTIIVEWPCVKFVYRGAWNLTTTFRFRYWRSISAATRARKRLSALSRHKSSLVCTRRQIRIGLDHRRSGFCSKKSPIFEFFIAPWQPNRLPISARSLQTRIAELESDQYGSEKT